MNQISKQSKLKDKFSKIEMDFDDENLGYDIPKKSLQEIQSRDQIISADRLKNLVRISKLFSVTVFDVIIFFYRNIVLNILQFVKKKVEKTTTVILVKEENLQMAVGKVLTEIEIQKKMKLDQISSEEDQKKLMLKSYYTKMEEAFLGMIDSNDFVMDNSSQEILETHMEFQLNIWNLISKKLIVSNMITNAKSIKIKTFERQGRVITEFIVEMEKKGHLWAVMFGKHFTPEINQVINGVDGKVLMQQVSNQSQQADTFTLVIDIKKMEKKIFSPLNIKAAVPLQTNVFNRDERNESNV